jgi:hypothetical protein
MKRMILGLSAAAVLAVPGAAAADGVGAGCSSSTHGATWKTPGEMFQSARDGYGVNPRSLADVHGVSAGQLVRVACSS